MLTEISKKHDITRAFLMKHLKSSKLEQRIFFLSLQQSNQCLYATFGFKRISDNPDQVTWGPGTPVRQHTVLRAGQSALPRALWHILWITQIVFHPISGTVHCVQHTPAGPSKKSTVRYQGIVDGITVK